MRVFIVVLLPLAVQSLLENPFRALLTMLGIVIGVAAVFSMLSIGEGAREKILQQLDSVEARSITIYPNWNNGRASARRPWRPFSERDVIEIRSMAGVFAATGDLSSEYSIVSADGDWRANVVGVDTHYLKANDLGIERGQPISEVNVDRNELVAVIGQTLVNSLFQGRNPIGERIKIQNIPFIIVGTVKNNSGQNWRGQDSNNFVLIPRSTGRNRLFGGHQLVRDQVRSIAVVGVDQSSLASIENEIDVLLRQSRGLTSDEAPDFRILNFAANRQAFAESQKTLSILLAVMGAVSLIVGGVGVMNIMLVAVTERTKEIGLRMAVGARRIDILGQFFTEAVLLCATSGVIGLVLGYLASTSTLRSTDMEMIFSVRIALLSFASSLVIGVIFGFLPAYRASRLNPIEALRSD